MHKRILVISSLLLLALGGLATCVPFASSLGPSSKADAALPRIDISHLQPGSTLLVEHPTYGTLHSGYFWGILFYKSPAGSLQAWNAPIKDGAVGMPDLRWWQPIYACQRFGPTPGANPILKCHDSAMPEWYAPKWQWGLNGKHIGGSMADMLPATGSVEGGFYVVGKAKRS